MDADPLANMQSSRGGCFPNDRNTVSTKNSGYVFNMSQEGLKHNTGPKYTTAQEMEMCGDAAQTPQLKKKHESKTSVDSFETTAAGAGRDLSMLFSKFADMFTEITAVDTAHRKELENLLQEAQNLQSSLKEKKNMLKQTLVQISETL